MSAEQADIDPQKRLFGKKLFDAVSSQLEQYQVVLNPLRQSADILRESPLEAEREFGSILERFTQVRPDQAWINATIGSLNVGYSVQRGQKSQKLTINAELPEVYQETLTLETEETPHPIAHRLPFLESVFTTKKAKILHIVSRRDKETVENEDNLAALKGSDQLRERMNTIVYSDRPSTSQTTNTGEDLGNLFRPYRTRGQVYLIIGGTIDFLGINDYRRAHLQSTHPNLSDCNLSLAELPALISGEKQITNTQICKNVNNQVLDDGTIILVGLVVGYLGISALRFYKRVTERLAKIGK